jgi:hypothetical protein
LAVGHDSCNQPVPTWKQSWGLHWPVLDLQSLLDPSQPAQTSYDSRLTPAGARTQSKCQAARRCPPGCACGVFYDQPCDSHRCLCCKLNRRAVTHAKQGLCGPCGRREVVTGLRFVRCGMCVKSETTEVGLKLFTNCQCSHTQIGVVEEQFCFILLLMCC